MSSRQVTTISEVIRIERTILFLPASMVSSIIVKMEERCYCIFEGGGAKGIAHVGALAALEESGLKLSGFAGTSAGAIIAALAAVGYRSSDMINQERSVLDLVDLDESNIWDGPPVRPASRPQNLFGPAGWFFICIARATNWYASAAFLIFCFFFPIILLSFQAIGSLTALVLQLIMVACAFALLCWLSGGLAALDCFERGLNQLLRLRIAARLGPDSAHRARSHEPVTFADLDRAQCPPLRVVAADITSREMHLFSLATTPDVGVASAVAASVCLPVIFKPWRIGSKLFLDGGLVSNLPAWTFDAERALDPDAWTAVVQVGQSKAEEKLWGPGIIKSAILTGIFGSGLLNVRNVDRLKAVSLEVDLKLLQFDPGLDRANTIVQDAKAECKRRLLEQLQKFPKQMREICERIRGDTRDVLDRALSEKNLPPFAGSLRVSIFLRSRDDSESMTAEYQAGFENSNDERIRLPVCHSIVGQAMIEREPLYLDATSAGWHDYFTLPQYRWLRKRVSQDMKWVFCAPYFKLPGGQEVVVSVDSETYIGLPDDLIAVALNEVAKAVTKLLDVFLPVEAFSHERTKDYKRAA